MIQTFCACRVAAIIAPLALVCASGSALAQSDVTSPGDPISLVNGVNDGDGNSGTPPVTEGVANAINNNTQKYLNFLDLGSGFIVTPTLGADVGGTVVTGLRLYTANDATERDPASYLLEGAASAAGPWTLISQGDLSLPLGRNLSTTNPLDPVSMFNQTVSFANSTPYLAYRLTFPTLRNAAAANSMQIAEVEILGVAVPTPSAGVLVALAGACLARRRR